MEGSVRTGASTGVDVSSQLAQRVAPSTTTGAPSAAAKGDVFSLRDLSVAYGGTPAVTDVTMDLKEREITAFIGPSGCGKSTVIAA